MPRVTFHRDGRAYHGEVAENTNLVGLCVEMIVKTANGEVMIPFVKAIVPSVDVKAGIITITPPPGLLEELPDEPESEPEDTPSPDDAAADAAPDSDEPATTPTPDGQGA